MSTIAVDKEELRQMIREAVQKKLGKLTEGVAPVSEDKKGDKADKVGARQDDWNGRGSRILDKKKEKMDKKDMEAAKKRLKEALKLLEMMDSPMSSGKPHSKREAEGHGHGGGIATRDEAMGGGVPGAMGGAPKMEAAPPMAPPAGGPPGAPMEGGKPTVSDPHAAEELRLFMDNDYAVAMGNQAKSIKKNLALKMKKGKYDASLAPKIWMYLVDAGAQSYLKQHGSPGDRIDSLFNKATRMDVAGELARDFEQQVKSGELELDDLIAAI